LSSSEGAFAAWIKQPRPWEDWDRRTTMQSQTHLTTKNGQRYMTQLAKHWSHKFQVVFDETSAFIPLPPGPCRMQVVGDGLDVTIEAADPEAITRLQGIVENHLKRFAFREPDLAFDWR
jgi:hypothetical protein